MKLIYLVAAVIYISVPVLCRTYFPTPSPPIADPTPPVLPPVSYDTKHLLSTQSVAKSAPSPTASQFPARTPTEPLAVDISPYSAPLPSLGVEDEVVKFPEDANHGLPNYSAIPLTETLEAAESLVYSSNFADAVSNLSPAEILVGAVALPEMVTTVDPVVEAPVVLNSVLVDPAAQAPVVDSTYFAVENSAAATTNIHVDDIAAESNPIVADPNLEHLAVEDPAFVATGPVVENPALVYYSADTAGLAVDNHPVEDDAATAPFPENPVVEVSPAAGPIAENPALVYTSSETAGSAAEGEVVNEPVVQTTGDVVENFNTQEVIPKEVGSYESAHGSAGASVADGESDLDPETGNTLLTNNHQTMAGGSVSGSNSQSYNQAFSNGWRQQGEHGLTSSFKTGADSVQNSHPIVNSFPFYSSFPTSPQDHAAAQFNHNVPYSWLRLPAILRLNSASGGANSQVSDGNSLNPGGYGAARISSVVSQAGGLTSGKGSSHNSASASRNKNVDAYNTSDLVDTNVVSNQQTAR